jgi:hypothetical protein
VELSAELPLPGIQPSVGEERPVDEKKLAASKKKGKQAGKFRWAGPAVAGHVRRFRHVECAPLDFISRVILPVRGSHEGVLRIRLISIIRI